MWRAILRTAVVGVVGIAISAGCIVVGSSKEAAQPTVGQELTDLKMALERGAITPGEFEAKKTELLARRG
jgi:hypothetical protein